MHYTVYFEMVLLCDCRYHEHLIAKIQLSDEKAQRAAARLAKKNGVVVNCLVSDDVRLLHCYYMISPGMFGQCVDRADQHLLTRMLMLVPLLQASSNC